MIDKLLLAGLLAGNSADVISTEIALQNPYAREGNVLVSYRPVRLLMNAGWVYGTYELMKHKSKRTKIIVVIASGTVHGYLTYHNLKVGRK